MEFDHRLAYELFRIHDPRENRSCYFSLQTEKGKIWHVFNANRIVIDIE